MIDWDRVSELRDEVGAEDFDEVVEIFLDEADAEIARLPQLSDAEGIEALLHFLKGSALNLGFSEFAARCSAGEKLARDGGAQVDVAAIVTCYDASKAELHDQLRRIAAA